MIGRIRDFGQNVLQPSCQAGSGSSPKYFHIVFLITFLEEAFIKNVIIILHYIRNYIIIICINDNNIVINNNHGILNTSFCSSTSLYASGRNSSKFIVNLDTGSQKSSPALLLGFLLSVYFCTPPTPTPHPTPLPAFVASLAKFIASLSLLTFV